MSPPGARSGVVPSEAAIALSPAHSHSASFAPAKWVHPAGGQEADTQKPYPDAAQRRILFQFHCGERIALYRA